MKEERKDIYILIFPKKKKKTKRNKTYPMFVVRRCQSLSVELHIPQLLVQVHWRDTS
jgi:hypothetical protein